MTVVKIGGKVVSASNLPRIMPSILETCERPCALIAGGGSAADLVRHWDLQMGLLPADAHWLAIRAMSLQAELLSRRLRLPLVESFAACRASVAAVLDLWTEATAAETGLPVGWEVTSDSLAAWAAKKLDAGKLVLVKSVGDGGTTVEQAAAAGWVDSFFETALEGLAMEWVNALDLDVQPG